MFNGWEGAHLAGLLSNLYIRTPKHGHYVYRTGDKDNNIYLIASGELEILAVYDEDQNIEESGDSVKFDRFRKRKLKKKQEIAIMKLSPGNYFGDEEGFDVETKRYSIKVTSNNTKILLLPKDVRNKKPVYIYFRKL